LIFNIISGEAALIMSWYFSRTQRPGGRLSVLMADSTVVSSLYRPSCCE
jgi:hypothetical protein